MARRLVQLKLRLLRNALHSSTAAQVSFLVSTALAILVAIGTFVVLALLRGQSASVDVTSAAFTSGAAGAAHRTQARATGSPLGREVWKISDYDLRLATADLVVPQSEPLHPRH
jgi:hypothetical protein